MPRTPEPLHQDTESGQVPCDARDEGGFFVAPISGAPRVAPCSTPAGALQQVTQDSG